MSKIWDLSDKEYDYIIYSATDHYGGLDAHGTTQMSSKRTICLYHRDGRVFKYDVECENEPAVCSKVTEHI